MPTAENGKLEYEAGQNATAMSALTDSGDHKKFTSAASLWSKRSGNEPDVKPDGLISGGVVTPAVAAGDDNVDVSALSCYLAGIMTPISIAADESITRPASALAKVNSITVTSAGAVAVVAGADSADTSFVETRGAAGGPPYIPVGDIEIAQVRVVSDTAAVITAAEIFAVVGSHTERYDFPLFDELTQEGSVEFLSVLGQIHTGDLVKGVFASYASPIFAEIGLASDFVPPETTHSVSSQQVYGTTLGTSSSALGQGKFTAYLSDGVTDALVTLKNENLWFRFYPDKYKAANLLSQGKLGIARTFPAGDNLKADCTISATESALERTA